MLLLSVHHAKKWPHGTDSILGNPERFFFCGTSIRKEYTKCCKFLLEKVIITQLVISQKFMEKFKFITVFTRAATATCARNFADHSFPLLPTPYLGTIAAVIPGSIVVLTVFLIWNGVPELKPSARRCEISK
jgi:hypothetical protein